METEGDTGEIRAASERFGGTRESKGGIGHCRFCSTRGLPHAVGGRRQPEEWVPAIGDRK